MTPSLRIAGSRLLWLLLILPGFELGTGQAQDSDAIAEEDPYAIKFPVETKSYTLRLVDGEGEPVPGVDVIASGVRCEEEAGSWFGWPYPNVGKNNLLRTDDQGEVTVQYPVRYGNPRRWLTTTRIDFRFVHSDYVYGDVEVEVQEGDKTEHTIKPGCPVLFTAQDAGGQSVSKFGAVVAGAGGQAQWKLQDGQLRSRGLPDGGWQTMLVSPQPSGQHLFSGILPVRYHQGNGVTIRDVKLTPGLELRGQVSLNVERPVVDGKVLVHCLPKPRGAVHAQKDASLAWSDFTEIQPDGSFVFKSLPRTGVIQIIALCRGWVIQSEPREGAGNFFVHGVQVHLDQIEFEENLVQGVELPMEPAGALKVLVQTEDGRPVVGAEVSTWPNQLLDKSGSNILGRGIRSADLLRESIEQSRSPFAGWFQRRVDSRFIQETDSEGIALLNDVPIGRQQSLFVGAENLTPNTQAEVMKYTLAGPEVEVKEVVMVPLEAKVEEIEESK